MNATLETIPADEEKTPDGGTGGARDLLFGMVGGAMVLLAVVLLFVGGPRDTGAGAPQSEAPQLELLAPAAGAELSGPLAVDFRFPGTLSRNPGGWGTGDLHIHLEINGREYMPSPRDIQPLEGDVYRWTLPPLPTGTHALRLFWAGPDHRPMTAGESQTVTVRSR
jgi:hypothetical protein